MLTPPTVSRALKQTKLPIWKPEGRCAGSAIRRPGHGNLLQTPGNGTSSFRGGASTTLGPQSRIRALPCAQMTRKSPCANIWVSDILLGYPRQRNGRALGGPGQGQGFQEVQSQITSYTVRCPASPYKEVSQLLGLILCTYFTLSSFACLRQEGTWGRRCQIKFEKSMSTFGSHLHPERVGQCSPSVPSNSPFQSGQNRSRTADPQKLLISLSP